LANAHYPCFAGGFWWVRTGLVQIPLEQIQYEQHDTDLLTQDAKMFRVVEVNI